MHQLSPSAVRQYLRQVRGRIVPAHGLPYRQFGEVNTATIYASNLVKSLVQKICRYELVATVQRGPLKGRRVLLKPGMRAQYIWHTQPTQWAWVRHIKTGDCVYDIGARFGQTMMHFAEAVGLEGSVVAFEPMPVAYRTLCRNVALNGLKQVEPVQVAIARHTGRGQFSAAPYDEQGRLASADKPLCEISFVALDDYESMGWKKPDVLKIDVEGGAAEVLAGADELLRTVRPLIYIELHNRVEMEAVGGLKDRYGYAIQDLGETSRICWPNISALERELL
jgi:FkbM family methyltransferase